MLNKDCQGWRRSVSTASGGEDWDREECQVWAGFQDTGRRPYPGGEVKRGEKSFPWAGGQHPWQGVQQVHQQARQLPHCRGERYDGGNERTPRESFRQQPDCSRSLLNRCRVTSFENKNICYRDSPYFLQNTDMNKKLNLNLESYFQDFSCRNCKGLLGEKNELTKIEVFACRHQQEQEQGHQQEQKSGNPKMWAS